MALKIRRFRSKDCESVVSIYNAVVKRHGYDKTDSEWNREIDVDIFEQWKQESPFETFVFHENGNFHGFFSFFMDEDNRHMFHIRDFITDLTDEDGNPRLEVMLLGLKQLKRLKDVKIICIHPKLLTNSAFYEDFALALGAERDGDVLVKNITKISMNTVNKLLKASRDRERKKGS